MADIDTLSRALKRAHDAGDVNAARQFAAEIKRLRASPENYTGVQHPEFDGSHIPGYDPATGTVRKPGGMLTSALRGAADTATFGYGDEIGSYLGSAITGEPRENVLAEMRDMQRDSQETNPGSYLAGQIGGGIAQGVAAGPGILANAASLGGRVLGSAATGALMGGAYGSGSGTDAQSRFVEGAKGAGIGGVAGAAFPLVAAGASKVFQTARNAFNARPIARKVGASPEALRMLGNVMDADGSLGRTGQANMARAGQEAMLADAGPNARAVLDTAIQKGGPGAVSARTAIAERVARGSDDIVQALDGTLGRPVGVNTARSAIRTGSAAARGSAYDDAYKMAIDYATPDGMQLEKLIKSRVPARAIAEANELMRVGGEQSRQILAKVADDGSVVFERLPDVRQTDYITRALNQMAESGDGAGALGGQTPKGMAYQNLSREIRDTLKGLVPEYGKALETAADPIRRSKAVEFGSKLLSPSVARDQVDEFVRGMTGPERQALAQGVRSRIDDVMANVTRTVQDGDTSAREAVKALKDMSSRANREKLTAVLGRQQADALFDEIDRVATSFDLRASVAENSKTYARLATDARVKGMATPEGPISAAKRGEGVGAVKRVVQALTGETPAKAVQREQGIYSELADILTRRGGAGQGIYNAVNDLGKTDMATRLMQERIVRALSGPHLSYPSTVLLTDRTR